MTSAIDPTVLSGRRRTVARQQAEALDDLQDIRAALEQMLDVVAEAIASDDPADHTALGRSVELDSLCHRIGHDCRAFPRAVEAMRGTVDPRQAAALEAVLGPDDERRVEKSAWRHDQPVPDWLPDWLLVGQRHNLGKMRLRVWAEGGQWEAGILNGGDGHWLGRRVERGHVLRLVLSRLLWVSPPHVGAAYPGGQGWQRVVDLEAMILREAQEAGDA